MKHHLSSTRFPINSMPCAQFGGYSGFMSGHKTSGSFFPDTSLADIAYDSAL